jgi:acetyltransferase
MAIVSEVAIAGEQQIVGVARLVADADHRDAEYAVLVADDWQGRGLGMELTNFSFEICRTWEIDRVYAETTTHNRRMQNILRKHNFHQKRASDGEALYEAILSNRASKNKEAEVSFPIDSQPKEDSANQNKTISSLSIGETVT